MEFYGSVQLYHELKVFMFRDVGLGRRKCRLERFIKIRWKELELGCFGFWKTALKLLVLPVIML